MTFIRTNLLDPDDPAACGWCVHHADSHTYDTNADSIHVPCQDCPGGVCDRTPRGDLEERSPCSDAPHDWQAGTITPARVAELVGEGLGEVSAVCPNCGTKKTTLLSLHTGEPVRRFYTYLRGWLRP